MSDAPISKEDMVLKLLAEGDVMLCLDARCEGVCVPPQHADDPALRLILNINFPHPIEVTAAGISANLSFGGRRTACYIPLDALWAAFDPQTKQGMLWPESMPPEVLPEFAAQPQHPAPAEAPQPRPRGIEGEEPRSETGRPRSTPPRRGHLRVVK